MVNEAYAAQPPGTTAQAQNVRGYDPRAGRDRGAQRSGLTKYAGAMQVNGSAAIQFIGHGSTGAASTTTSNRLLRPLVVAGGTVKRFSSSNVFSLTGGGGALSSTASAIFGAQIFQQTFFADGSNFKLYDATTDQVSTLTASAGSLPTDSGSNKPRLVAGWRNRLVFAGLPLDPFNWFMSRSGTPTDFNYAPSPTDEQQAVAGNNSTAGVAPDIVQCLIPYNDEILLFLCDHTLWQLTGDPVTGGRIDLVSDGVGGAFGEPWCRDSHGTLYFVSNRGAVYSFIPGGLPQRLSDPIAELLLANNMLTTLCRMAWDERQFGFHVWYTPTGGPASATHYFYDTRNQSWWQDVYGNTSFNPLAVHALDGDVPGERVILLGGQDGYLRKIDNTAVDDDGTAISSSVTIGPLQDKNRAGATLADLQCALDTNSGPVNWAVYAGQSPQQALTNLRQVGTFATAGRNRSQAVRVFGHAIYVQLSNPLGVPNTTWALEYLGGRARTAEGKARQRIF